MFLQRICALDDCTHLLRLRPVRGFRVSVDKDSPSLITSFFERYFLHGSGKESVNASTTRIFAGSCHFLGSDFKY